MRTTLRACALFGAKTDCAPNNVAVCRQLPSRAPMRSCSCCVGRLCNRQVQPGRALLMQWSLPRVVVCKQVRFRIGPQSSLQPRDDALGWGAAGGATSGYLAIAAEDAPFSLWGAAFVRARSPCGHMPCVAAHVGGGTLDLSLGCDFASGVQVSVSITCS